MKPTILILAAASLLGAASVPSDSSARLDLERAISRTIQTLPEHTVYDSIEFRLGNFNQVTLDGEVTSASIKVSAERALRQLAGVGAVVDNLKVRPLPQEMMR